MKPSCLIYFSLVLVTFGCGSGADKQGPMASLSAKNLNGAVTSQEVMQSTSTSTVAASGDAAASVAAEGFIGVASRDMECPTVDVSGSNLVGTLNLSCDTGSGINSGGSPDQPVAVITDPTPKPDPNGDTSTSPKLPKTDGDRTAQKDLLQTCPTDLTEKQDRTTEHTRNNNKDESTQFCDTGGTGSVESALY